MSESLSQDMVSAEAPGRLRPSLVEALLGLACACLLMEVFLHLSALADRVDLLVRPPAPEGRKQGVTVFREGETVLRVPYLLNSLGFRDREHAREKPAGTLRVGLFGDSFLPGFAVAQERILPRRIEEALGPGAEVLSFGSVGQGTRHQLVELRERAAAFGLDAAVLFFFQNDPWDNSPALSDGAGRFFRLREGGGLEELPGRRGGKGERRSGLSRLLNEYSRLYRWQKQKVEVLELWWKRRFRTGLKAVPKVYHPLAMPMSPALEEAWTLTELLLEEFFAEASRRGIRPVVVDVPLQEGVFPERLAASTGRYPALAGLELDWGRTRRRLEPLCRSRGVSYLDLREVLSGAPEGAGLVFESDGHFTEAGHRVVGRAVAEFLSREGLTPDAGKGAEP